MAKKEIAKKLKEISEKELEKITGGSVKAGNFVLYYQGTALPMNSTVSQLTATYPFLKDALGDYYAIAANMTLNFICTLLGQEAVQDLIDEYEQSEEEKKIV